jgi:hypothetical protein
VLDEARLEDIPEDSLLNELDRSITPSAAKADWFRSRSIDIRILKMLFSLLGISFVA